MNYELAKQMKDAGYDGGNYFTGMVDTRRFLKNMVTHEEVYAPTLSELIKACGHVKLECFMNDGSHCFANCCDIHAHQQVGNTPEEAVSKLWLALNNK